ncbi:MAG TPA: RagB/SusD family nutrient uptake outer membrane protein [Saprospiraceae bacterium]|nr:RagB/SusD family nutrient uptake outer membrane protein [Saprospiraceae bacterium]
MKKIIYLFTMLLVFITLSGCKDYLDVEPETKFTNTNFWTSESNLESFSYGLYDAFPGYGNGGFFGGDHFFSVNNDDVIALDQRLELDFPTVVPATTSGTDWSWSSIRKANVLIKQTEGASLDQAVKDKYVGVGRLFRALLYWDKVRRYGDVPFYSEPIEPTDERALFAARDSRVDVVDHIVADLDFAIAHLPDDYSKVKVTKWTALAAKSRICLAAATTFKYHNVSGADVNKLLNASVSASNELMSANFSLADSYSGLFYSEDLSSNTEVILMKKYNENMRHSILSFIFHEPFFGFSNSAVSAFLMADGKPISYDGAAHPNYSEWVFNTTDTITTAQNGINVNIGIANGRDKRMASIIDTTRLVSPFSKGIPMFSPIKYASYDLLTNQPTQGVQATTDAPIFRLGEVLLNFAEAKAELGGITQADLDASINLLRARAGVAPLMVGVGFSADDRDPSVDPLLWEIRRERRVELMLEPFRKWDLIRWAKGTYYDADNSFYGVKVAPTVPFDPSITVLKSSDGHLYSQAPGDRRTPWDDRKYLEPIPANQLTLNSNLTQNPGW